MIISPGLLRTPARLGKFLVAPNVLRGLTLTRAQTGGALSTAVQADGTTLATFGADVARFNGASRRLLVEGQRTNSIRNPRAEGGTVGVIGSGGVAPTNWVLSGGAGLTSEIIEFGTADGIRYVRIRLSGTATATAFRWILELQTAIAAAVGQVWTHSLYHRLVSGSLSSLATQIEIREFASGVGGTISSSSFTMSSAWQRATHSRTLTDAGTTTVQPSVRLAPVAGTYDLTFDLGFPQLEQGAFASSVILPPASTPGASTRGADVVSATLASLGIGANGACTVLWSGVLPQAAPSGADQVLHMLDDGTSSNRYIARNDAGTSTVAIYRITGGSGSAAASAGSFTPGTPFRFGFAIDGSGRIAASLNGNAVVSHTGGPTSGLTTFRLSTGASSMFGETGVFRVLPYTLSDADLQAAVAALPT